MIALNHFLHLRLGWRMLHGPMTKDEICLALGIVLEELYAAESPRRHEYKPEGTRAWIDAIDRGLGPDGESFDAFIARNQHLLRLDGNRS